MRSPPISWPAPKSDKQMWNPILERETVTGFIKTTPEDVPGALFIHENISGTISVVPWASEKYDFVKKVWR